MAMIEAIVIQLLQMTVLLVSAPLLTGIVRKVKARGQRRRGQSIVQPYYDLLRLLGKEAVVAETTSWLFRVIPYFVFAATWVAAALIPTFAANLMFSWSGDLIAITALLGSARFALALAGMDAGTSFGGIGSSREMMVASLAEPAMLMIVFSVALIAGSTQLSTIAEAMLNGHVGLRVSLSFALVALMIVAIAENGRIPVDNPATHLELTMVHEAMVLEYSGRHLAMIELAGMLKLSLYLSMIACIFLPSGMAADPLLIGDDVRGLIAWGSKMVIGLFALGIAEMSVAKMRLFRVPNFLGAALMLGFLGVLLLFVSRGM
jgi:formate hydrogenlyase subunit 4